MSNITSSLNEFRRFAPSDEFIQQANITPHIYQQMLKKVNRNYTQYWADLANEYIKWHKPFNNTLDESNAPFYQWFDDGVLNVSYNCLDQHLAKNANKPAIIFENDSGTSISITYQELYHKVCQFANGLKSIGIIKGDRVIIYLPNGIEAVVAMQACARIGAIHSVVFAGFSAKALNDRINDASAKLLITANEYIRAGKILKIKEEIDAALSIAGAESIKHVVVHQQTNGITHIAQYRDIWWHDLIKNQQLDCEPEWVEAEHPLFILYTSGSTGKPKGVQHSSAGYLLGCILTMNWVFDIKQDDIYWCTADVGWITGHSYVAYGPLSVGVTQLMFDGVPTYPQANRFWQIIEKHKVSVFYTAPTAIRSLIKLDSIAPSQHDLSSLRLLGSVGEPINPEAWVWYYEQVGNSGCPIVDTWWQTETGCNILSPLPGINTLKPGSCNQAIPGIMVDIIDDNGDTIHDLSGGYLVIKRPFPSQIRTIWNNPTRFKETYFPQNIGGGKYYIAGDSAHQDHDGDFWIMGRIDDVLNVSGHRLGTMEIESALVANKLVAEAAVVSKPHDIKGESIIAFVVCKGIRPVGEAKKIANDLRNWVGKEIGPIARPDEIRFGDNLPKTRSGKIMRRLLRNIARGDTITQDISTLENPAILEQLKE